MQDYTTLKKLTNYLQVKDFIIENSHLFSDTAFKVILNLFLRVDFNLSNCLAVMSFSELRQRTAKTNQSLQRAIRELEKKGILTKISGKYSKTTAFQSRVVVYNSLQKPMRSYNETNVYDLTNLVILAGIFYKLRERYEPNDVREFFHQVRKHHELTGKPYLSILSGVLGQSGGMPIGIGVCLLGKSDMPIGKSDMPIGKSDMPIGKEPIPVNQDHITHTHTIRSNDFEEERGDEASPEGTGKGSLNNKTENSTVKDYPPATTSGSNIDNELKDFILKDLLKQEQEGKIQNANAVFKTLTEQDIEIYREKMKRAKLNKIKVVVVYNGDLSKLHSKEKIEKLKKLGKLYRTGNYTYILVSEELAQNYLKFSKKKNIELKIRELTDDFKKYFPIFQSFFQS